ncbi:MAG: adenylate/guanylate cyclase domain-containing protein, partial [Mariprofundaceae bacterium]
MLRELPEQADGPVRCGVGFGLHCGRVLFGLLGDEGRREFTVIGDVVNTAARLCGIAHPYQALLTEAVFARLPRQARRDCRFLRSHRFKGKKAETAIYELVPG